MGTALSKGQRPDLMPQWGAPASLWEGPGRLPVLALLWYLVFLHENFRTLIRSNKLVIFVCEESVILRFLRFLPQVVQKRNSTDQNSNWAIQTQDLLHANAGRMWGVRAQKMTEQPCECRGWGCVPVTPGKWLAEDRVLVASWVVTCNCMDWERGSTESLDWTERDEKAVFLNFESWLRFPSVHLSTAHASAIETHTLNGERRDLNGWTHVLSFTPQMPIIVEVENSIPSLSCGWQEMNSFSHYHCLPGSLSAGSWNQ